MRYISNVAAFNWQRGFSCSFVSSFYYISFLDIVATVMYLIMKFAEFLAVCLSIIPVCAVDTIVDLSYSKYEGTALPGGITQWLGIRYAVSFSILAVLEIFCLISSPSRHHLWDHCVLRVPHIQSTIRLFRRLIK